MTKKLTLTASAVMMAAAAFALTTPAHAEKSGTKAGVITCNVDSGWGFIFGSTRELNCNFQQGKGPVEHYAGHIHKFGVDIGYQAGGVIIWAVLAPTTDVGKGALAGEYGGVSGSASAGVGVGANVLIGGFKDSITLQPVSIEGMTGLNVAAGISQVTLEAKP